MAIEKTRFDNWLKNKLWRDLIFRSIIWALIACLGAYFTLYVDAVSTNDYLIKNTKFIFNLLNTLGSATLFLALVALFFKDMEALSPVMWGYDSKLGGIGGLFRRLAGDLTLWTLGLLVSVLFTVSVYGVMAEGFVWQKWAIYSLGYLITVGACFVVAFLNLLVRRADPSPLALEYSNAYGVAFFYVLVIACAPIYVYKLR